MTIKKRLFWSNILMIFVPVGATALVGMLCVGIVWLSLMNGAGLGLKDQEDFDHARMALTEMIESRLSRDADLSALELLLDNNGMSVAVWQDGQNFYRYGASKSDDDILMEAAEILGRGRRRRNIFKKGLRFPCRWSRSRCTPTPFRLRVLLQI